MKRRAAALAAALGWFCYSPGAHAGPQLNAGVLPAFCLARAPNDWGPAFCGSVRADLMLGRERARDFGVGPYVSAGTLAFDDLRLAAGPSLLVPYAEDFPFVLSLGGLLRDGRELGLDAALFWGTRSYNFQGVYNLAFGFSLGWQHAFAGAPNDVVLLAAHVDGMVLALPFVAAYSAIFR